MGDVNVYENAMTSASRGRMAMTARGSKGHLAQAKIDHAVRHGKLALAEKQLVS